MQLLLCAKHSTHVLRRNRVNARTHPGDDDGPNCAAFNKRCFNRGVAEVKPCGLRHRHAVAAHAAREPAVQQPRVKSVTAPRRVNDRRCDFGTHLPHRATRLRGLARDDAISTARHHNEGGVLKQHINRSLEVTVGRCVAESGGDEAQLRVVRQKRIDVRQRAQ